MNEMEEEVEEIVTFIKSFVKENGKRRVVLGLSGGLDSAVVAILCKKALGNRFTHCFYLPYGCDNDNRFDVKHIDDLCAHFDLTYSTYDITKMAEMCNYNGTTLNSFGNVKARLRMTLLYKFANEFNALVIGTSNKSELMIGYFTKYGDGGVDFEPLGHLYKTQVFELAKYLDIPNEIVDKPPTAGLWKGQTDEKEIGLPYGTLDMILNYILINQISVKQKGYFVAEEAGLKKKDIDRVIDMINNSRHKRMLPPML